MSDYFAGPEPGTFPVDVEARLGIAAMRLAGDANACEALMRGLPVARSRLDRAKLALLGEPLEGDPLTLSDELALRIEALTPLPATPNGPEGPPGAEPGGSAGIVRGGNGSGPDVPDPALAPIRVLALDDFLALPDPAIPSLIGTTDDALLVAAGFLIMAGEGGASKTTLTIDAVAHLASGSDWLGWPVPEPIRILVLENEGPRHKFRAKLEAKTDAWAGKPFRSNVYVYADPWGHANFADAGFRRELRAIVEEQKIDMLVGDPLGSLGSEGEGSPSETRQFLTWMVDVGVFRDLAFWALHHFNKGDSKSLLNKLSGAWGGHPDSVIGVHLEGKNRTKITYAKCRWGDRTGDVEHLAWDIAGRGFRRLELEPLISDEDLRAQILAFLGQHAEGSTTRAVREVVKGGAGRTGDLLRAGVSEGTIANLGSESRPRWTLPEHVPQLTVDERFPSVPEEGGTVRNGSQDLRNRAEPFVGEEP